MSVILFQKLALLTASFFFSDCLYISLIEHPARMLCTPEVALKQWQQSYPRAAILQVIFLFIGTISALISYFLIHDIAWLIGGAFLFINFPFTFVFLMPTNKKLLRTSDEKLAKILLETWGKGHFIRTIFSFCGVLIMAWEL